jgi:putative DNA primase/helicase
MSTAVAEITTMQRCAPNDASTRFSDNRPAEYSDDSLALKFTERHRDYLRYTAAWGRWSLWDGCVWRCDDTLNVINLARDVCRDASAMCNDQSLAPRLASAATVSGVERLARADRQHAATVDQWDSDPWLLNTPGGVVDLRTGNSQPASQTDYMTKIAGAAPGGDCPLWCAFLSRITDGDQEFQRFLQRMAGYCLTGKTTEDALFFLYGTGANGKSVFLNTISGVMGDYAKPAPIETFIASRSEHHPTGLAGLQGARLITAVETEEGRQWAEAKLKTLTGGDRIPARFMRQDFFEYAPQFKLAIAGNHKPGLRSVDEAMRRRFHLLPFTVTIPASERDSELEEKLRREGGGILRWMIDGCLAWQSQRLCPPKVVRDATAEYLAAEDALARWVEDRCVTGGNNRGTTSALWQDWREWTKTNGEFCESQKWFSPQLEARGFAKSKSNGVRGYKGIALRTDTGTDGAGETNMSLTRAGVNDKADDMPHPSLTGHSPPEEPRQPRIDTTFTAPADVERVYEGEI